jgi:hypothetical protein
MTWEAYLELSAYAAFGAALGIGAALCMMILYVMIFVRR